jgi:hypothetical protein
MARSIDSGIWISPDNSTWYKLTDDNRDAINSNPMRIEQSQRMANGTMRKFVIASKNVIDVSWKYIPAASSTLYTGGGSTGPFAPTTDGNYGAGFMKAFYNKYVFQPIYVRVINSTDTVASGNFSSSQSGTSLTPLTISTITPGYSLSTPTTGSVTYTTSSAHGLSAGQVVDIAGIFPVEYNGSYIVNAVTSTQFAVSNISIATPSGTTKTATPRKGTELYTAFITNFQYEVVKRFTLTDYVNVSMQFTEI